jgi:H+/gluconate symporter-like permease
MRTFISNYLPFLGLLTWNSVYPVVALLLFLFCIWLGWGVRWRSILLSLPVAAVVYVLSLLMCHNSSMFLCLVGGSLSSIVVVSLLGAVLGKLLSQGTQKRQP